MQGTGKTSWHYLNTDINTEGTFEEDEEWAVRIQGRGETGAKLYVDDISISPGPCPAPGNCDFEDGLGCGWIQDTHDDLDWLTLQADSPANLGGPIYDHTHMAFDGKLICGQIFVSCYYNTCRIFCPGKCQRKTRKQVKITEPYV